MPMPVCEKCNAHTHRDDAMNERCNDCERIVRLCPCPISQQERIETQ